MVQPGTIEGKRRAKGGARELRDSGWWRHQSDPQKVEIDRFSHPRRSEFSPRIVKGRCSGIVPMSAENHFDFEARRMSGTREDRQNIGSSMDWVQSFRGETASFQPTSPNRIKQGVSPVRWSQSIVHDDMTAPNEMDAPFLASTTEKPNLTSPEKNVRPELTVAGVDIRPDSQDHLKRSKMKIVTKHHGRNPIHGESPPRVPRKGLAHESSRIGAAGVRGSKNPDRSELKGGYLKEHLNQSRRSVRQNVLREDPRIMSAGRSTKEVEAVAKRPYYPQNKALQKMRVGSPTKKYKPIAKYIRRHSMQFQSKNLMYQNINPLSVNDLSSEDKRDDHVTLTGFQRGKSTERHCNNLSELQDKDVEQRRLLKSVKVPGQNHHSQKNIIETWDKDESPARVRKLKTCQLSPGHRPNRDQFGNILKHKYSTLWHEEKLPDVNEEKMRYEMELAQARAEARKSHDFAKEVAKKVNGDSQSEKQWTGRKYAF